MSENEGLTYHGKVAATDNQKAEMIFCALGKEEIKIVHCCRVGNQDQGPGQRGRFLLAEFSNQSDRNDIRNAANILNTIEELKKICIKVDLTKEYLYSY